ncbi:chloramphenicol acetyltransferase [Pseudothauera nasutitermitis]|uniref:Chloramphenicol acetyltransferase n=1 Tax=Pseudothauera nasutitermitis TaxID=2565930 RepID=A0A4V3WBP3_9RHOO|nr:DapH/DapD/GlmU-related protein [Pseudothauera nasutitermitis]THF63943.1 chloramphenicol acetyltransferase [Pseudothauera nasutitermitis]
MKKLSPQPTLGEQVALTETELGPWTEIGDRCTLENVRMGAYSYCGPNCILQNVEVGKFANIAAMVRLGPTAHPLDRPTLHHFTYRRLAYGMDAADDAAFFAARRARVLHVGHDTWIGHGAIVMPGLRIGDGAIIGSGAVVTRDVAPWTIVAGNPARLIRRRFSPALAAALERSAWWDWPHELLRERLAEFCGPVEDFARRYGGYAGEPADDPAQRSASLPCDRHTDVNET